MIQSILITRIMFLHSSPSNDFQVLFSFLKDPFLRFYIMKVLLCSELSTVPDNFSCPKSQTNCLCQPSALLLCASLLNRVWLFVTLWTITHQAPLFTGFSRQEHWDGLPFPPLGSSWPRDQSNASLLCRLHCRWAQPAELPGKPCLVPSSAFPSFLLFIHP